MRKNGNILMNKKISQNYFRLGRHANIINEAYYILRLFYHIHTHTLTMPIFPFGRFLSCAHLKFFPSEITSLSRRQRLSILVLLSRVHKSSSSPRKFWFAFEISLWVIHIQRRMSVCVYVDTKPQCSSSLSFLVVVVVVVIVLISPKTI